MNSAFLRQDHYRINQISEFVKIVNELNAQLFPQNPVILAVQVFADDCRRSRPSRHHFSPVNPLLFGDSNVVEPLRELNGVGSVSVHDANTHHFPSPPLLAP
jgi:hypothetical protein